MEIKTAKTRIDWHEYAIAIDDAVKKVFALFEQGTTYNKVGFTSSKHGFLSWEGLVYSCLDEGLKWTEATEGNLKGKKVFSIPDEETFERIAARHLAHREQKEAGRREAEVNSPRTLESQATELLTTALRSLDFHEQMNTPRDGRRRPGPQLDLTPFKDALAEIRDGLSEARFTKDPDALKSIIEHVTSVAGDMERAVVSHLIESIESRLGHHAEDLSGKFNALASDELRRIVEGYEKSNDTTTARRALVELNKKIGAEVKVALGSTFTPRERDNRGGRGEAQNWGGGSPQRRAHEDREANRRQPAGAGRSR